MHTRHTAALVAAGPAALPVGRRRVDAVTGLAIVPLGATPVDSTGTTPVVTDPSGRSADA